MQIISIYILLVRSHQVSLSCQVEDVYFPKERGTGRRRPFCFVTFTSLKVCDNGYLVGTNICGRLRSCCPNGLEDDVCPV